MCVCLSLVFVFVCSRAHAFRTRSTHHNIFEQFFLNNNNNKMIQLANTRGKCDVISSAFITFTVSRHSAAHTRISLAINLNYFIFLNLYKIQSKRRSNFSSFYFISFCCFIFFLLAFVWEPPIKRSRWRAVR